MHIPYTALSAELLQRVIEDYVTREGTEYGWQDVALETKVGQVLAQIKKGEVVISFDPETESCTLQSVKELKPAAAPERSR